MQPGHSQPPSASGLSPGGEPTKPNLVPVVLIAVAVILLCLISLSVYFVLVRPSGEQAGDETEEEADPETDQAPFPAGGQDSDMPVEGNPETVVLAAADNMLRTKALYYEYEYSSHIQALVNNDPASEVRLGIEVTYRFRGENLDDPRRRIVAEGIYLQLLPAGDASAPYLLEVQTVEHQDDFYIQLVDMSPHELAAPGITQAAIDQLKGKWLRFTPAPGAWLELQGADFERLRTTEVGRLLRFLEFETVGLPETTEEITFLGPLNFFSLFGYSDFPLAFGYLEEAAERRRIIDRLVSFQGDGNGQAASTVSDDCVEAGERRLSCGVVSNPAFLDADLFRRTYQDVVDAVALNGVITIPSAAIIDTLRVDPEVIVAEEAAIVFDTEAYLPVSGVSETLTAHQQAGISGEGLTVNSQNRSKTSYISWNQELNLTLPAAVTPLSELR